MSKDLLDCTHVFIRHDAVRKPLQQPYDGPFLVTKCTDKHFTIQRNNHEEVVSIDRLKPAYIDTSMKTDTTSPTSNTSSIDTSPTKYIMTPTLLQSSMDQLYKRTEPVGLRKR